MELRRSRFHLTDAQRLDWLRLIRSENVGPRTFRTLLNHCGSAGAALRALPDLARRGGAGRPVRICPRDDAERELAAAARMGVAFLAVGEDEYPARLATIDDAPPLLAVRGHAVVLSRPVIAIVGSRKCLGGRRQVCGAARARPWSSRLRGGVGACPRH